MDADEIARAMHGHWFKVYDSRSPRDVGCVCGWRQEADDHNRDRHNAHLAQVLAPLVEQAMVAAEQVGREDNAEHDQCYVYGSCALEAKLEQARQEGAREALRAAADEIIAADLSGWLDLRSGVANWLRDLAERAATPGSGTAGGGT
jgi:hypothetical protein